MQQGSQSGGEIRSFRAQVCGINTFKLIVIAATLCSSSSSLKMTDKELKLNLIGLNIIIAVLLQLCQEPEHSIWKAFSRSNHMMMMMSVHTRQRLWIPIYSIYWFFVKNHEFPFASRKMVFKDGWAERNLGGKWWKPKSSISGTTVNDIVHVYIRDDHDGKKCTWPFGKQSLLYWLR